jgi:4-hydroxy-tetrahydrodipicolinate synthase
LELDVAIPESFGGIVPPVCTPFTEDHEVDVASLEKLLGYLLEHGVHGVFMLGSTSETATLTDAQRATVLDVAVRTVGGQVPVLAGVIDMSTGRMIEHGLKAKELGVDALVSTGPFYIRPSQEEIAEHFRILQREVGLPVIAYDIPSAVQIKLERATVSALAHEGVIAGIKDSSGQDANFRGVVIDTRDLDGFAAFTGSESMVDSLLQAGADGCVPGIGNVDPAGFVRIYDAVRAGDLAGARKEQDRLFRLFDITRQAEPGRMGHTASALGGFKTALQFMGVISTNVTGRPMTRLNDAEAEGVREVLVDVGLM